jgi:isopropylmalate/homocitrate/citramalate synthase
MMECARIVESGPGDAASQGCSQENINRSIDESIARVVPAFDAAKRQGIRASWMGGVR